MVEVSNPDEQLQALILSTLNKDGNIADSDVLVSASANAQQVDAALKSLLVDDFVVLEVISKQKLELTKEGAGYAEKGTPEYQYASALDVDVVTPKSEVEARVGAQIAKIGFAKAMSKKWVKLSDDKQSVVRLVADLTDEDMIQLRAFQENSSVAAHDKKVLDALKKRKLVSVVTNKSYKVTKGSEYAPERQKLET